MGPISALVSSGGGGADGTNLSSGEQWWGPWDQSQLWGGGGGRGTNLSSGEQWWGPWDQSQLWGGGGAVGPISALVSSGGGAVGPISARKWS